MSLILFSCNGGHLVLPDRASLLVEPRERRQPVVNPPRAVWERSELTPAELTCFAFLVAAAGRAMIDVLPQLEGGCINYWEAGNWALNDEAEPKGARTRGRIARCTCICSAEARVDRSGVAWGESPRFPRFADKESWAAAFERLTAGECYQIVSRTDTLLRTTYGLMSGQIASWSPCDRAAIRRRSRSASRRTCARSA